MTTEAERIERQRLVREIAEELRRKNVALFSKRRQGWLLAALLSIVFCILLFAKLSALQAYVVSACFVFLAGYAVVLGLRD